MKLDSIDLRTLTLLQRNGRLSNRKLAELLRLSESACWERVRRLEAIGAILGYGAIVAPSVWGRKIRTWVDIRISDPSAEAKGHFESQIAKIEEVDCAYELAEAGSYLLKVCASDMEQLSTAWETLERSGFLCHATRRAVIVRDVKPPSLQALSVGANLIHGG